MYAAYEFKLAHTCRVTRQPIIPHNTHWEQRGRNTLTFSNIGKYLVVDTTGLQATDSIFIQSDSTWVGIDAFFPFENYIAHAVFVKENR
jgi:hypothetical protein